MNKLAFIPIGRSVFKWNLKHTFIPIGRVHFQLIVILNFVTPNWIWVLY